MQFKPYPLYIPCDIHWFNEIPQSWKQVRVEQYLIKKDENIGDLWDSTQLLSLTQNGIIEKDINDGKGKTHSDYSTYQAIDIGDLVFCLFDIDETPRTVGLSTKKGMITSAYTAFKSKENINTQYVYYFFESLDDAKALKPYYKGLRKTVRPPEFLKIHVPFPPKVEQVAISQFLDTETARIDNLIAKQEKLIELLEEQRKSIISHAVTKGLNPNAPMKESGVEWLGEVPEHFDSIKIKQLAISKLTYGANESAEQEIKEHPRYIRITDIKNDGTLNPESFKSLPPEIAEQYLLANNDILFARSGATVGKTFKYSDSWGVCCFAGYLIKLSVNVKIANPDYVFYYLNSYPYWEYIASNQSQSTIQNVSAEKYANFTIAIPKIFEQEKIVSFLDSETSRIDSLIAKQEKLIEKLKEYRSTIISHAVTGKIDVREFGA